MYITRSIVNKTLIANVDLIDMDFVQVSKGDEFYVVSFGEKRCLCNCNGNRFYIENWFLGMAFKKQEVMFKRKSSLTLDITHTVPSFESASEAPTDGSVWNEFMTRPRKQGGLGL